MGSEWKETTLGEFAPFNYGKGLPKRKRNPEGGIPVYGSNGITGYHDEALIEKGIIIGRKGSIGKVEYSEKPFWPIDTTFYVEESPERDIRFTYYLLKSLPLQEMNSDSAVPGLNRNAAHSLKIKVPDLDEQKRIAHILGTLDDKIELNQRMNETLEAIARAIFKSWFVDFDPVKAKMAGEPYPLPDAVMALFPDALVESELGMIPKGWEVTTVGDVYEFSYGKSLPKRKRILGQYPVYGSNGIIGTHDEKLVKGPGIVIGRKGNPGFITWAANDFYPIDTTFYVKTELPMLFAFYQLDSLSLPRLSADSAVPGLNRNIAYLEEIVLPEYITIGTFVKFTSQLYTRINFHNVEIKTLTDIKDSLIPKLIY